MSIAILVSGTYSNLVIFKDTDEAAAVSLNLFNVFYTFARLILDFPSSKCPDNHSLMGRPHIRKHWFRNGVQWAEVLDMCLIVRSSVSRLISLVLLVKTIRFQLEWIVENQQCKP